jgi:probable phosphoglycerate mutase
VDRSDGQGMTVRLLLVRHGHVDFGSRTFTVSPRGRQWDPPLDRRGREQAERLAARLALMGHPAGVYVSPFRRCGETLEPYLRHSGLRATVLPDLGELFVGEWEGVSFEEIISADEEMARRFREQDPMFSLTPGGESGVELRARVIPAVEGCLAEAGDGSVLVVTHGGVINAYLGHVLDVKHDMFFLPDNTSFNTVLVEGDRREIRFLNDIRHLTHPAIFAPPPGGDPEDAAAS